MVAVHPCRVYSTAAILKPELGRIVPVVGCDRKMKQISIDGWRKEKGEKGEKGTNFFAERERENEESERERERERAQRTQLL